MFIFSTKSIQQHFHIYALVLQDLCAAQVCKRWLSCERITKQADMKFCIQFLHLLLISQVLKSVISSAGGKPMAWLLPQASTFPARFCLCPGGTEGCPHIAVWEPIQSPTCKGHSIGNLVRYWHKSVSAVAGSFNKTLPRRLSCENDEL